MKEADIEWESINSSGMRRLEDRQIVLYSAVLV